MPCLHWQVKTFVELVGSLLSASGSPSQGLSSRPPRQGSGASVEMARAMKEGGVIKALTNALALLDLDHPKVWAVCMACTIQPGCAAVLAMNGCRPLNDSRMSGHHMALSSASSLALLSAFCYYVACSARHATACSGGASSAMCLCNPWVRCNSHDSTLERLSSPADLISTHAEQAVRVVGSVLKPLEMLVRPLPPRHKDAPGQPGRPSDCTLHPALPESAPSGADGSAAADQRMRDASAVIPTPEHVVMSRHASQLVCSLHVPLSAYPQLNYQDSLASASLMLRSLQKSTKTCGCA